MHMFRYLSPPPGRLRFGSAVLRAGSLASVLALASLTNGEPVLAEPAVDFARQILPILSNKCFACHGPDTHGDEMLRLDSFASATADRGGYRAIDPESPEESELLARIHSEDAPMPPAEAEKQLTDDERELLSRWVREGGEFAVHWAFVAPRKAVPAGFAGLSGRDTVDAFIAAGLGERGISFAPQADRATLARRAALVLTGLPPEPQQLAEFLGDLSPGAYERFVEELLSSPRYGEHQARYWLDAVRYGDTHGLHLDNRRGIYPYRDWVVQAFNDNLPLDTFLTWQLAGDLLPDPTLGQRVATGFVRLNPTTSEGGAIPAEFQCKNNFDRVETLGTALLGLSLTCAVPHPQIRSDSTSRVLPVAGVLQQHGRKRDGWKRLCVRPDRARRQIRYSGGSTIAWKAIAGSCWPTPLSWRPLRQTR